MFGTLYLGTHQQLFNGAMYSAGPKPDLDVDSVTAFDYWVIEFEGTMAPVCGLITDDAMENGLQGMLDCVAQNVLPALLILDRPTDATVLAKSFGLRLVSARIGKADKAVQDKCGLSGGDTYGLLLTVRIDTEE